MTQPNILELAKQGDAKAIALLLNRQLQAKGITAAASLKDGCLQVMLEAAEAPSKQVLAGWVGKSIAGLGAASIEKVKVYGRQTGAKVPAWSQEFEVAGQKLPAADVADVTQARANSSENTESNQLGLKERAKLGDVEAIASLLNIPLQNKGITAAVTLQDGCLQVMLESGGVPDEEVSIRIVRRELTNLKAGAIASVKVYGQQAGEDFPAWNREFELVAQTQTVKQNNNVKLNKLNNSLGDFNLVRAIFLAFFMVFMFLVFINNWFGAIIILILGCYVASKLPGEHLANVLSLGKLISSDDLVKESKSDFELNGEDTTAIPQKRADRETQNFREVDRLQEIARKGDLRAIASLIQQGLAAYEVHVDAEIQYSVMLWLKLKSDRTLDSQTCLNVVSRILNKIQPDKIRAARISQIHPKNPKQQCWNKYLAFKDGQFVDNTRVVNQITGAFCAAVIVVLLLVSFMYKPTSTTSPSVVSSSSTSGSTASRTFLGKSQTGYELWADKNCVYVKGITEGDLARLNTDVWGFKEAVKAETGYKCVLFE